MSLSSAQSKEAGMGPKTIKPRSMAGLVSRYKKPDSLAGFRKRLAAFTAVHAAIKTNLFRAEKCFLSSYPYKSRWQQKILNREADRQAKNHL
jgi:hypothetical protein